MAHGRGLKPQLHLKLRWKKMDHLMAEKLTKIIKTAKLAKFHAKKIFFNNRLENPSKIGISLRSFFLGFFPQQYEF